MDQIERQIATAILHAVERIPVADRPWNDRLVPPITEAVMAVLRVPDGNRTR